MRYSGIFSATAYLQVTALARAGEPEIRIVFYFSIGAVVAGALTLPFTGGLHAHTPRGLALLLAVGALATVAQLMMTRAYSTGRTLVNASLQYLGIAWSFLYGAVLFDDPVTALALLGMALIVVAGIAAAGLRRGVDQRRGPGGRGGLHRSPCHAVQRASVRRYHSWNCCMPSSTGDW